MVKGKSGSGQREGAMPCLRPPADSTFQWRPLPRLLRSVRDHLVDPGGSAVWGGADSACCDPSCRDASYSRRTAWSNM